MLESARAHSISRRAFLRRATVVTAGVTTALIVGEEAWEAFERLQPHRVLVPGGFPTTFSLRGFTGSTWYPWQVGGSMTLTPSGQIGQITKVGRGYIDVTFPCTPRLTDTTATYRT